MDWNKFWGTLKEIYIKEDNSSEVFDSEKDILELLLKKLVEELKDSYEFIEAIGRGGAGIVFRLKDKRLDVNRALKIPRPKKDKGLIDSAKTEIEYLKQINHANIIKLYAMGELKVNEYPYPFPYFVMDYIKESQDIKKKVLSLLNDTKESKELKQLLIWLVRCFSSISDAIYFLHKNNIIHFDIKPSNILIDAKGNPLLSDLGFAKKKSDSNDQVVIGFTLFYAHPDLKHAYDHMSSKNRIRKKEAPCRFEYKWDIYSFGKSLLEILSVIDQKFPDMVIYDYNFVYLHLLACRLLDGRNLYPKQVDVLREKQKQNNTGISVYKESWMGLDATDFKDIKYKSFYDVYRDIGKLLEGEHVFDTIPELDFFYQKRIQCSEGIPASFSQRVKLIVEHPIFARLDSVPQLGLLSSVYPTATHTRLEHSLGVYRNSCLYVQSLLNDKYNPLFKQIINEKDIKCILLLNLLHDLGYYPLAHEIGEYNKKLKHENFTLKFLDNSSKDKYGNKLKDIIENQEWGWGVKISELKDFFESAGPLFLKKSDNLKVKLISSIFDGPIDTDKLDYLRRDSQRCYLRYGELIDFDRLLRNLTVIITKDKDMNNNFTIGVYEKGQSAAESIIFARYLLYQSLYWHHTSRSIRAMLRVALLPALRKKLTGRYGDFIREFDFLLGINGDPKRVTIENVLKLIKKWTNEEGKEMIDMIINRNYFKRTLTIHSYKQNSEEEGKPAFIDTFRRVHLRSDFSKKLQKNILYTFNEFLDHLDPEAKVSLMAPERINSVSEILSLPNKILCDCPEPEVGTVEKLRFIPEPQRIQKNYFIRTDIGERVSEVWQQVYFKLINIASKGRIFCHPDIRDTLMAVLGPKVIKECLENTIKEFV